jgi:hypothetical protein
MAREAVRLLIEQIKGRRSGTAAAVAHKLVKYALIQRESTAAPGQPAVPAEKTASRRKTSPTKP